MAHSGWERPGCIRGSFVACPGEKIKNLLAETGGDFKQLEISIRRLREQEHSNQVQGGWVTEIYLEHEKHWDADMIAHSKEWARARGLFRTSPIHGRDEWKIPLDESFLFRDRTLSSTEATTTDTVTVEARHE